jgi:NADH pyrophosphatase NudC (nudix superfamily)
MDVIMNSDIQQTLKEISIADRVRSLEEHQKDDFRWFIHTCRDYDMSDTEIISLAATVLNWEEWCRFCTILERDLAK